MVKGSVIVVGVIGEVVGGAVIGGGRVEGFVERAAGFDPGNPRCPCDGRGAVGFVPRGEVSPFAVVVRNRVIQPPSRGVFCMGVCPSVVIETVARDPDRVGPGEEKVKIGPA